MGCFMTIYFDGLKNILLSTKGTQTLIIYFLNNRQHLPV
jgi:hypothetical protein